MISGKILRDAIISGANNINNQRSRVDELNVFPVPDGDTGTNMGMTIGASVRELQALDDSCTVAEASKTAASAMLRGARGNSGVITSLLFRGFSKALEGKKEADVADIVAALKKGVEGAYKAVMKPTEGTILTVARVASEEAAACGAEDVPALWDVVMAAGQKALEDTPNLLPVLKKAGVVDAGGQGIMVIFEGMGKVFHGEGIVAGGEAAPNKAKLSTENAGKGVFTDDLMKVEDIKNGENMHEQFLARQKQGKSLEKQASAEKAPSQASEFVYAAVDPSRDYGFVAVAAGEGLKSVFTDLAADAVVSGGQTMNPSTEDILAAIQSVPAKTVFVLPNNKNIIMAAEQAEKLADRQVVVLPTRTVPMGITAMLNFDPSVNAETNTINMMAAADKVSTGLITYAARDSEYDGKRIKKGEIMALENGKIVSTSTDITKATYRLARGMCKKDSSFVTIISGCDVSDEDAEKVTEMVKAKCPNHVEVSHIRGGQPVYYYMISVE